VALKSLYEEPRTAEAPIAWPALELHDVFRIFRSGPVETVALRGVDLTVDPGELVVVWGPSGSGKSTLLHLAAGLDRPSAGEVRSFGRSLAGLDDDAMAEHRARRLAVVFQAENLWPGLSAEKNVELSLRLAGIRRPRKAARAALAEFGLAERGRERAGRLSGGEQQRVAIASAGARRAPLVLADEPTGELDVRNESLVLDAMRRLRDDRGSALVVVSHSDRVAAAADRVVELRDGRLVT
jgi:putative ABC transport system ATP-binding protein